MKHRSNWWWLRAHRHMLVVAGCCLMVQPVSSRDGPPVFKTSDEKMLYLWGTVIGNEVAVTGVTDSKELEWILRGLRDRVAGQSPAFAVDEQQTQLYDYVVSRLEKTAVAEEALSLAYVREKAKEPNAIMTQSGLVYRELLHGDGAQAAKDSKVKIQYVGTLRNGWVFDSSRQRGAPLETSLTGVIGCWSEAIPMMRVGGKATITCPPELAYGHGGTPTISPGSALTFDVELLEVDK